MSLHKRRQHWRRALVAVLASAAGLGLCNLGYAQFITQQVGGVSIDAQGIVKHVRVDDLDRLKRERAAALQAVPGDLNAQALRKVSLRQLEAAIAAHREQGTPLSDDIRYLAGLQRVQYVFVYPQQQDIVLAGPGEGWKLNDQGEVVGRTTGLPVLLLDDLLVALRSIEGAQHSGISCSIDPRKEGLARLQALTKNRPALGDDPSPMMAAIEQALGPQTISVTGVPDTSHFARVLVAADYRMKRLAMGFEAPPISGLPSFLQMMKAAPGRAHNMMPRWWLAPDYDALLADAEGLAFEFGKASVKAMTEEHVADANGQRQAAARENPLAKKWATNMTSRYEALSAKDTIFGQLRNCMDLAVVAALIQHRNLADTCGWSMPLLLNPDLKAERYHVPKQIDTEASTIRKGSDWIITASGGVLINPWQPLEKATTKPALADQRAKAAAPGTNWWWN